MGASHRPAKPPWEQGAGLGSWLALSWCRIVCPQEFLGSCHSEDGAHS